MHTLLECTHIRVILLLEKFTKSLLIMIEDLDSAIKTFFFRRIIKVAMQACELEKVKLKLLPNSCEEDQYSHAVLMRVNYTFTTRKGLLMRTPKNFK